METRSCPQCGAALASDAPEQPCPACLMKLGLESWTQRSRPQSATEGYAVRFSAPEPGELGQLFPQFEILQLLGAGGMGAVYKARQKSLDRLVALKIIRPEAASDPGFAERFAREARTLALLAHQNIVTIHDFGQSESLFYLVMEYVDGVNLRQMLESGELDPQKALAIVPHICAALQYAHDEGVVHRDIKPENILIDSKGRVKIADFGLAKLTAASGPEAALTGTRQVMGTPRYMAPEQMKGAHLVDHRADIYSLGVVFYEMLTGEAPVGHFALPSKKRAVDARLDEIVLRTLASEPDQRYQRASDVKLDVEAIMGTEAPPVISSAMMPPSSLVLALQGPARALFLVGIAGILSALMQIAWSGITLQRIYASPAEAQKTETKSGGATQTVTVSPHPWRHLGWLFWMLLVEQIAALAFAGLTVMAALGMARLEFRGLAFGAAIGALVPISILWPVTFPVGLWVLLVLRRRAVVQAFAGGSEMGIASTPLLRHWDIRTSIGMGLAVAVVIATLLPWSLLSVFGVQTFLLGIDDWFGLAAGISAGVAALALAAVDLYGLRRTWRGVIALAGGTAVSALSSYSLYQLTRDMRITSQSSTGPAEMAKTLEQMLTTMLRDGLRTEPAFGVYATICVGGLLLIFGAWQLRAEARAASELPPPALPRVPERGEEAV